jgi:pimeloyl-ACP methyl ester carboxylesterase
LSDEQRLEIANEVGISDRTVKMHLGTCSRSSGVSMLKVLVAALVITVCGGVPTRAQSLNAPISKDVAVLSFKLHYLEAGTGKPVILLHGLGGDSSRWDQNINTLAADFHVFALDQIGFRQSDKPMANYHLGMLSEFLVEFMNAVRLPKASLGGNSLGAAVAEYTAVHYPERVDRLVVSDAANYCLAQSPGASTLLTPHVLQIMNGVTRDETRELFRLIFHDRSNLLLSGWLTTTW